MMDGLMIFLGFYLVMAKLLKLTRNFEARRES